MDEKGQGALEYLIIVAAVLAIAAVVIVIISGAFTGGRATATVSEMQTDASRCASLLAAEGYEPGTPTAQTQGEVLCTQFCDGTENPRWFNYEEIVVPTSAAAALEHIEDAQDACYAGKPDWFRQKLEDE